ncbi:hypothetical protein [Streptomyces sp. NPDC088775]|uniref:hypothetical protein n=1 Tax=Streptomyces sp. NPDC088775 TaxID=3365896 RepID=UPI003814312E
MYEYLDEIETRLRAAEYELLLRILCRFGEANDGTVDITPAEVDRPAFTRAVHQAVVTCWEMLGPAVAGDRGRLCAIVEDFETELRLLANDAAILDGILLATADTPPPLG